MQELELAMNLALYGLLCSLGNQYIIGSLSWSSLTFTANTSLHEIRAFVLATLLVQFQVRSKPEIHRMFVLEFLNIYSKQVASLDQRLCFRYTDSTIPLLPNAPVICSPGPLGAAE